MKPKIIYTIISLLLSSTGFAQVNRGGVYLSIADYKNRKLTCEIDSRNEKDQINSNGIFNKSYITVIHNGKKYTYGKKYIFGYKDCDNKVYRFSKNDRFELQESGKVYVYSKERRQSQGKNGSTIMVKDYYFSSDIGSEIIPLTVKNLKTAFPDNSKFNDMLKENFKDGLVYAYDNTHKMFKVNHLYQMSLGQ